MNKTVCKTATLTCLAVLCFAAALYAWAIASPIGSSPDEDFHQAMLYCAAGEKDSCLANGDRYGHCFTMRPTVPGSCQDYRDLDEPLASKIKPSETLTLYYDIGRALVSDSLEKTTINIRVMNTLLAVLMFTLALVLTVPQYRPQLYISLVVGAVPASLFFLTSLSPSAWAIISAAAVIGPFLSFAARAVHAGEVTTQRAQSLLLQTGRLVFVILALLIGLGSRYESFLWTPIIVFFSIAIVLFTQGPIRFKRSTLVALSLLLVILTLGITFVFSERASISPTQLFAILFTEGVSWWVIEKSLNTLLGVMSLTGVPGAELGTHDVPMPALVSFLVSAAVGGILLRSISSAQRASNIIFFCLLILLAALVIVLWSTKDWDYYQPRYFLPIFYFVLFVAAIGIPSNQLKSERKYWSLILIASILAYSVALLTTLLRFIYGLEFQDTRYPLGKEALVTNPWDLYSATTPFWWLGGPSWLSPFITWVAGSVSFFIAVMLGWRVVSRKTDSTTTESC